MTYKEHKLRAMGFATRDDVVEIYERYFRGRNKDLLMEIAKKVSEETIIGDGGFNIRTFGHMVERARQKSDESKKMITALFDFLGLEFITEHDVVKKKPKVKS